jgi:hypothetical protein
MSLPIGRRQRNEGDKEAMSIVRRVVWIVCAVLLAVMAWNVYVTEFR